MRPSSYIKTEGSPVTRAADNVSRVLGGEFNASEGVIFIGTALRIQSGNNPNLWCASNNNRIRAEFAGGSLRLSLDLRGAGMEFNNQLNLFGVEGVNKIAVAYRGDEIIVALNGNSQTLQVGGSVGTFIKGINLGRRTSSNYVNDPMSLFNYIPRALSAAELEALTAL